MSKLQVCFTPATSFFTHKPSNIWTVDSHHHRKKKNMKLQTFLWYLIPFPLILKPYFISISYKGLKHSNISRNVNSFMFSNVFVLHHIHSLPCETSVLSLTLTPRYFGANSPDQTCFLTHKPSLVTSEQSWAETSSISKIKEYSVIFRGLISFDKELIFKNAKVPNSLFPSPSFNIILHQSSPLKVHIMQSKTVPSCFLLWAEYCLNLHPRCTFCRHKR